MSPTVVAQLSSRLSDAVCYEIPLGNTIGCGTPAKAQALVSEVGRAVLMNKMDVYFHDTYGQALTNIHAILQQGVSVGNSSRASLGGCPYAKGALGNVVTEDELYMLDRLGIETAVDMTKLLKASAYITRQLGRSTSNKVALALNSSFDTAL